MANLIICTDEGRITATAENAPAVHAAYKAWRDAGHHTSEEAHLWKRVLEEAGIYLDDNTEHDGEEVVDVYELTH